MNGKSTKRRFHLVFPVHLIDQPVLYRLVRDYDLIMNIRRAHVLENQKGMVILELQGPDEVINQGIAYLEGLGIEAEESPGLEIETK